MGSGVVTVGTVADSSPVARRQYAAATGAPWCPQLPPAILGDGSVAGCRLQPALPQRSRGGAYSASYGGATAVKHLL